MLQDIALLFPFICSSLWAITLLIRWKYNSHPTKAGAMALIFIGIASFIRFFSLQEVYKESGFYILDIPEVFCTFGFFSCLILYFRVLTGQTALSWKSYLVFLPGILFAGILFFIYMQIGETQMAPFIRDVVHSYEKSGRYPDFLYRLYDIIYFYIYNVAIILFANIVIVYAWIRLNRYKEETLIHHQAIFRFLFMTLLFTAFTLIWNYLVYNAHYTIIGFCMFLWGCALFYLGYHISRVEYIIGNPVNGRKRSDWKIRLFKEKSGEVEMDTENMDTEDHTDEETWCKIKEKLQETLDQLITKDMIFLERNLRLEDMALKANTNRTYLSRLLKEEYGCGFPEYISRKRIEYACKLIHEKPNLTLEQLAEKTGFLYASTFSRTFKQHTGVNFREWKKSV